MNTVDAVLAELEAALRLADASATPVTPAMLADFVRNVRQVIAADRPTPESEAPKDDPGGLRTCNDCEGTGTQWTEGIATTCDECEGTGAV